jgi:hypothetical protein
VCQTDGECEFVWVIVLPFKEDSDVTAADGAMTSLPMVPLEECSPDKLEASRRPEDVRLGL